MMILIGLLLLLLALLGAPLFTIIAASAMLGFYRSEVDLSVVAIEFFRIAEMPILLAIPLFTFAGYLLGESSAPQRLVRLTHALLGWMPGGLAIVSLIACALFTAFTGASGVTIVALGALLYPALTQSGYKENFGLGLVTTSGSLGLLFAPALPLILYAVIAQQLGTGGNITVNAMFLAGILPGLLMLALLSLWSIYNSRGQELYPSIVLRRWLRLKRQGGRSRCPCWCWGGSTAASSPSPRQRPVTVIYLFIVEVLIKREIGFRQLPKVMRER